MNNFAFIPKLTWNWAAPNDGPRNEEDTLIRLLSGIAESGSLAQAAKSCDFSYRHAWGLIRTWEANFGQTLVDMTRGRGSSLAPLGLHLVRLDARIRSRFAAQLANAADEARRELSHFFAGKTSGLVLHASHDPALVRLPDALRNWGAEIEMHVMGSSESLASLAAGRCDIAGFHCPQGPLAKSVWPVYRGYLDNGTHLLVLFARRAQGLMVAASNPQQITALSDLTRPELRFVNRQPGSGTRILLDLLLAQQGIAPSRISSYHSEEFTHAAVAAIIASGGADVGLGVGAAARRFGLEFIPLAQEDYYLAIRRDSLNRPELQTLFKFLASPEWATTIGNDPDYELVDSGKVLACDSAWGDATGNEAGKRKGR